MNKKILIVDDEQDLVEATAVRLEKSGYEVVRAYDAKEAIDAVSREKPDLILLDNMLPHSSGLGLLEMFKSFGSAMLTPVVLMTASISDDIRKKALAAGATDFIAKPVSSEELLRTITKILGK